MKKDIIFLLIVTILCTGLYFYNHYSYRDLDTNPKYVVGIVTNKLEGKNGADYICQFIFTNIKFDTRFSGLGLGFETGDKVLIKLQESSPSINVVLSKYHMLPNFLQINFRDSSWKEVPQQYFYQK